MKRVSKGKYTKDKDGNNLPIPVMYEGRICFAIEWFNSEPEADVYARHVRNAGDTYNGGWFDGSACGREKRFDCDDGFGNTIFAVSIS